MLVRCYELIFTLFNYLLLLIDFYYLIPRILPVSFIYIVKTCYMLPWVMFTEYRTLTRAVRTIPHINHEKTSTLHHPFHPCVISALHLPPAHDSTSILVHRWLVAPPPFLLADATLPSPSFCSQRSINKH
jgi:hypothetical protein